jgi:uncharacterized membrane protein YeaQ/YmgE (transglycosylase-associated protein family)
MPLVLIAIVLVIVLGLAATFWITGQLIGMALHLFMAGVVGALADAVVPGRLPYGWLGAIAAGLVGSWLGTLLLGHLGPSFFGVPLIPAFVGAAILAFGLEAAGKLRAGPR